MTLDVSAIRKDFPILARQINGKPLVYLDNASTTQKPRVVIDELVRYYETMNANIHRGIHTLSEEATDAYEGVRAHVARFIGAHEPAEIIFTRNATESINLVAYTWGEQNIQEGDVIVVTALEHHSNLVPWQELCRRKKSFLKIIPMLKDGSLDLSVLEKMVDDKVKLVAVTQISNVLGTIVPLEPIIAAVRKVGAKVLVDGAQGVANLGIDVLKPDIDFLVFSSHKMFGPTGVGVLYGKRELLEKMPPFLFGGDMVKNVSPLVADWNDVPWKFEAGTPNIADVIAFGKAIEYLEAIGFDDLIAHERELARYAREKLSQFPGLIIYGSSDIKKGGGIVSFNVPNVHPHDVGSILNEDGISVRAGHHCSQPLMQRLQVPATVRMSFSCYNTQAEIDVAVASLEKVYDIFKVR